jgi:hypothetical protein
MNIVVVLVLKVSYHSSQKLLYTVRQKLSTTWLVSIISFLIMKLFQIGVLFSLPVHTYLLTCETGYWSIFIYVYMTGCVKCYVYFSTFVFATKADFFLCRVLSFIFYWFGTVRRKLTIPEKWQAVGMHNGGFSHSRFLTVSCFTPDLIISLFDTPLEVSFTSYSSSYLFHASIYWYGVM